MGGRHCPSWAQGLMPEVQGRSDPTHHRPPASPSSQGPTKPTSQETHFFPRRPRPIVSRRKPRPSQKHLPSLRPRLLTPRPGARLLTALLLIAAIWAVLVAIAAQREGQAEATGAALEVGGRARACRTHTSEVWEVLASARGTTLQTDRQETGQVPGRWNALGGQRLLRTHHV